MAMNGELKAMGASFHYSFALITTPLGVTAVFDVAETGDVRPHIRFLM
jgi:hypothetical protein